MIVWVLLNIASAVIVSMIVVFKLTAYGDDFILGEKIGMGTIAAGMLMRVGPILGKNLLFEQTPFDDWSTTLLHVGLTVYFIARMYRVHRHWIVNHAARNDAKRYLKHRAQQIKAERR